MIQDRGIIRNERHKQRRLNRDKFFAKPRSSYLICNTSAFKALMKICSVGDCDCQHDCNFSCHEGLHSSISAQSKSSVTIFTLRSINESAPQLSQSVWKLQAPEETGIQWNWSRTGCLFSPLCPWSSSDSSLTESSWTFCQPAPFAWHSEAWHLTLMSSD